jgi:hypothetical protein
MISAETNILLVAPNCIDLYSFTIKGVRVEERILYEFAPMIIMIVIMFGLIWGGFVHALRTAFKAERRKMQMQMGSGPTDSV